MTSETVSKIAPAEIRLERIRKSYTGHILIDDYSFSVASGEFVSMLGANGCGKSTILKILSGVEKQDSGLIIGVGGSENRVSFVFQNYRETLLPWESVRNNILFPLRFSKMSKDEMNLRLSEVLTLAKLNFQLDTPVYKLSGGQAQLVQLLRAVVIRPTLLLLDEPCSALDHFTKEKFWSLFNNLRQVYGFSALCVTHDLDEAIEHSNKILVLSPRPSRVEKVIIKDATRIIRQKRANESYRDLHRELLNALKSVFDQPQGV